MAAPSLSTLSCWKTERTGHDAAPQRPSSADTSVGVRKAAAVTLNTHALKCEQCRAALGRPPSAADCLGNLCHDGRALATAALSGPTRDYLAARLALGVTRAEAEADAWRVRRLGKAVAQGRITMEQAQRVIDSAFIRTLARRAVRERRAS